MEPNISDMCRQATKLSCFFQIHRVVKLFFNTTTFLKPSTETNFNQKTTLDVHWETKALSSTNLWHKIRQDTHWDLWMWAINQIC